MVQREFRHLKLEDIAVALQAIPRRALLIAACWTVLSYGVLTFYDRLGTIYAGHKVTYRRVAFASFCAYALSHNLGFAAVSGAAVRYRLYAHWGLTPLQIAKVVAFCSLTFGLGGMVLGGAILFLEPGSIPFFGAALPHWMLYAVGLLLWGVVAAYVTLSRVVGTVRMFGHEVQLPGWRMAILQVMLATVDVAITASIFYTLLPHAPGLTWLIFLGVYVASYTAGLAANLPGGIGVFDTAMLLGLSPYLDAPVVVGAIVVFRLYYYVIPLFLAGGLFAGNELLVRGSAVLGKVRGPTRRDALARWREPDFAVAAATGVVALCGALLLALGVIAPAAGPDLDRPRLRRSRFAGQPVRALADRRRPHRAGDWPVTACQPRLGCDDRSADRRRGVQRGARGAAVDRRRAGAGGVPAGTVPGVFLPPCATVQRTAAAFHCNAAVRPDRLHPRPRGL